ncbi:PREDICTED: uncharacterized protein LOC107330815 [Acropora digitifera]|uniref:uncharacterized protein LOC107330815 n=1 Tax=Acropora digitifera TaxID=70779 RepID=UPI00077A66ED|nr:PREDICTED: uncharacterized protein LOC107330815 [Acropora digitifera]
MLDELELLSLSEVLHQRITERERFEGTSYLGGCKKTHGGLVPSRLEARENGTSSVMHRKRNTDIAQDRCESFQVSVSRRIVAIVVKWTEEIFRVMYSGKREEKGINIFSSFYSLNSSTFSRKRNCYRLN